MSTAAHKPLAASTITALRAIVAAVLEKPKTYNQLSFLVCPGTSLEQGCVAYQYLKLTRTARGLQNFVKKHTQFGITAWHNFDRHPFFTATKKDLKLNHDQARLLMGEGDCWPTKYWDKYVNAKTPKGRARALSSYIEFFIKTDGTCLTARERKLAA